MRFQPHQSAPSRFWRGVQKLGVNLERLLGTEVFWWVAMLFFIGLALKNSKPLPFLVLVGFAVHRLWSHRQRPR